MNDGFKKELMDNFLIDFETKLFYLIKLTICSLIFSKNGFKINRILIKINKYQINYNKYQHWRKDKKCK